LDVEQLLRHSGAITFRCLGAWKEKPCVIGPSPEDKVLSVLQIDRSGREDSASTAAESGVFWRSDWPFKCDDRDSLMTTYVGTIAIILGVLNLGFLGL
jgi:hypothetical protein